GGHVTGVQTCALPIYSPYELLSVLEQPTAEMAALRLLLMEGGHYPTRRTWERRLRSLPDKLPAQIGCLGRHLVHLIQPWERCGRSEERRVGQERGCRV